MLSYNAIQEFLNNIFASRCKNFDTKMTTVWVREIANLNADLSSLHKAEQEIMEDETIELKVPIIKKVILNHKEKSKLIPLKHYCEYCNGTGLITITAFFDNDYKYHSCNDYALKCNCQNATSANILQANMEKQNCETKTKNGYLLAWKSIVERASYLKRVRENGGYDFMKVKKQNINK